MQERPTSHHRLVALPWLVLLRRIVLGLLTVAALLVLYAWIPPGDDWPAFFHPAALALLQGKSPYESVTGYYTAPWALLPLIPIALLPFQWGRIVLFFLSLASFAYGVKKLTSHPLSILLFLTSVPVVFCLNGGNIDWLMMLAFVTPAPYALMLAAIKPQIGIGIAFYWFLESWHQGGVRLIVKNFLPVSLLLIVSFIFYGFWPLSFLQLHNVSWNASPFPYLVPIGVFILILAIPKRESLAIMTAGLFFSPYFSIQSIFASLLPLLRQPKLLAIAWTLLWILILAKGVLR